MKKFNKKGFTIVELVIVIAVIGILAGVLIPTFSSITQRANETAAMQEATAGRDAILVLTQGTMNTNTKFYINEYDKAATSYTTNYVFAYENGAMESKNIKNADEVKAPTYKTNTYVAYVSTEVLNISDGAATGFKTAGDEANYTKYLASLLGYTVKEVTGGIVNDGDDFITITVATWTTAPAEGVEGVKGDEYKIQVYWSADLHDTCVIFLAGSQA